MAAVFPGAPDLDAFWDNIVGGVDAISDVPASRLEPALADAFACKRGGFIAPTFDPIAFGIMPRTAESAEPDQLLALEVAQAALGDAAGGVARDKTGVILGRGGYLTTGMARLTNRTRTAQQLAVTLRELLPDLDRDTIDRIRAAFVAKSGELAADGAIGLVPNLAASRIANRLDLRGPAYTVDAACASSLIAVDHAVRELDSGRCDAVIAGGVHVCHDVTFWSVFAQLGALSKSSAIRPFDRRADGILIGEGCGLVVLKRLADAERAGDRVYAVIRGTGVSSDGRESSAMRPRADGQLAALDAAWHGIDRDSVGLVEAHGTATPTGDEVELGALAKHFGPATGRRAALGSVKSMIGHAMPAAGAAGLIKTALALYHGVLPPSLHCDEPHEALAATKFRVLARAEDWSAPGVRRAGVSAFGFGGINAHVVLDARGAATRRRARKRDDALAITGDSIDALRAALDTGASGTTGTMRMVVLDPTPERRALAHKVLDRGKSWQGKSDIWFAPKPLAGSGGKLAFVFPGVEATFAVDVGELDGPPAIATALGATSNTSRDLELRGLGVFALGKLLHGALARDGITPHAIAGHSLGEWTGMVASEMIPRDAADAFVGGLAAGTLEVPDVVFAAVGCGADGARAALDGLASVAVSHDNCPHQSILCGRRDSVRTALERLGARGVLCQELPFRSGFHSPLFADYLAPHRAHVTGLALQKPRVPLWSATTCAPYPDEPAAIRALAIDHLVQPVRFRELVETLYADGVRAFVQLGVGSIAGFVEDTLRGREHLAISAASAKRPAHDELRRVRAALWTEGFVESFEHRAAETRAGIALQLAAPLVRLGDSVPPLSLSMPRAATAGDPILGELLATLDEAAAASRAVVDAYRAAQRPRAVTVRRALSAESDPALLDHCFYRQAASWPTVSDRYPVVPMTMTIQMMIAAAQRLAPGRVAIAVEDIRAYRWLAVAPPVEIELAAKLRDDDPDRVDVTVSDYSRGTVRFADEYPPAPAATLEPLRNPHAAPMTARGMYDDRWMFHGPAYQGVSVLGPMGDNGVDGAIDVLPAEGALLDCAGQLMGWWVMQTETHDRLAMPMRIRRIQLFAPEPPIGERVACHVRVRDVAPTDVTADLQLVTRGGVWADIAGWQDRRFDSDDAVWDVLMYPERNVIADARDGFVVAREHWRAAASRELMMRRYLTERERAAHDGLGPRARRGWLLGRIALKDAVRLHAWRDDPARPIFPAEIEIGNEPSGKPVVVGRPDLAISVAHKDDIAVAIVGEPGQRVGIDVEKIAPRSDAFDAIAYTPDELALAHDDEARTRLWAAKEAVAKALGTGITDPKRFAARPLPDGRLSIASPGSAGARSDAERRAESAESIDLVVDTRREGDYVIAWTRR
ncbi:MAG TPA: beta-ketoacyl synthase N-terminal-like domain-containing protein [Kofleriaceae bacterium]|nr:beta-ketoacyl synthase N-terminal-like domain-containing protein [Kofleriaceae bacterium]